MRASTREGIGSYLRILKGTRRVLNREEEYELSRRARAGDHQAFNDLASANLPFVVSVARQFERRGGQLDDLIQEGNLGLMKAVEHFDSKKNVRFGTYAVWWVRAYMTRYLKESRSQVKGRADGKYRQVDLSLDAMLGQDDDETLMDRLMSEDAPADGVMARLESDELVSRALHRVKKRLGDLGWDIVQERLTQDKPKTLEELGARWGVSRERVRQVEIKTKSFLARYLSTESIDSGLCPTS